MLASLRRTAAEALPHQPIDSELVALLKPETVELLDRHSAHLHAIFRSAVAADCDTVGHSHGSATGIRFGGFVELCRAFRLFPERVTASDCAGEAWAIPPHDGPNHLGLWFNGLFSNIPALIPSDCAAVMAAAGNRPAGGRQLSLDQLCLSYPGFIEALGRLATMLGESRLTAAIPMANPYGSSCKLTRAERKGPPLSEPGGAVGLASLFDQLAVEPNAPVLTAAIPMECTYCSCVSFHPIHQAGIDGKRPPPPSTGGLGGSGAPRGPPLDQAELSRRLGAHRFVHKEYA